MAQVRQPRRAIEANLSHLAPGAGETERRAVAGHVSKLGGLYGDSLRLPSLSREDVAALVEWEGLAHLDAALARGKGVLAVTGHVGNWEVGPSA